MSLPSLKPRSCVRRKCLRGFCEEHLRTFLAASAGKGSSFLLWGVPKSASKSFWKAFVSLPSRAGADLLLTLVCFPCFSGQRPTFHHTPAQEPKEHLLQHQLRAWEDPELGFWSWHWWGSKTWFILQHKDHRVQLLREPCQHYHETMPKASHPQVFWTFSGMVTPPFPWSACSNDHPFSEEIFLNMQCKPHMAQPEAISSCPMHPLHCTWRGFAPTPSKI